jgi:hypothetical protein
MFPIHLAILVWPGADKTIFSLNVRNGRFQFQFNKEVVGAALHVIFYIVLSHQIRVQFLPGSQSTRDDQAKNQGIKNLRLKL